MPGATAFPDDLDRFAADSPTHLSDPDATGRDHAQRHDDVEAAIEALMTRAGMTVTNFSEDSDGLDLGDADSTGRVHSVRHSAMESTVNAIQSAVGWPTTSFGTATPAALGTADSSGRTHSQRHDAVETAVMDLQDFLGVTPTAEGPVLLAGAALYLDAYLATSAQTVLNRGTAGTAISGRLGSSTGADSNDPTFLAYDGAPYVYLPGVAGNSMSVPDAAAVSITGDIDIIARVCLDDWTPAADNAIVAKWLPTGSQKSYMLLVGTTGLLSFLWTSDGATNQQQNSTVATGFTDGTTYWIHCTRASATGDVKFYYAADQSSVPVSWTQLGTTVAGSAASLFDSTALVEIGSRANYTTANLAGRVYRAIVKNGIDGTTVLDVDCSVLTSGAATSFTEQSSNAATVTINRSTSGRKSAAVVAPCWLLGTDDYIEVPDNASLDFGASDSFTVLAVVRKWANANSRYMSKQSSPPNYYLDNDSTNVRAVARDGTNTIVASTPNVTAGTLLTLAGVLDRTAGTLVVNANGTTVSASASGLGSMASAQPLLIGSAGGAAYADMELVSVAVWRRALTAAEIATLNTYFSTRTA